jgi:hypothetical protein
VNYAQTAADSFQEHDGPKYFDLGCGEYGITVTKVKTRNCWSHVYADVAADY